MEVVNWHQNLKQVLVGAQHKLLIYAKGSFFIFSLWLSLYKTIVLLTEYHSCNCKKKKTIAVVFLTFWMFLSKYNFLIIKNQMSFIIKRVCGLNRHIRYILSTSWVVHILLINLWNFLQNRLYHRTWSKW
jgi:hypothetical protein